MDLREVIESYPDFPKAGIFFRDVSPVFRSSLALTHIAEEFYERLSGVKVDTVAGIESRGFVVATVLARRFGTGMIMIRKAGKLPGATVKKSYQIEYGSAVMELQQESVNKGQSVLVADDLIATGGTASAAAQLIEHVGGKVAGFAIVIELARLKGGDRMRKLGYEVESLVVYD